jgi:hypothetical protein
MTRIMELPEVGKSFRIMKDFQREKLAPSTAKQA